MTGALYGVVGFPVAHSMSPAMHTAAYEAVGIDARYVRLPVPPELFDETVRALPQSGFSGINVTVPHKAAALALADHATPSAKAIGAANTLTFSNGAIAADNTDAPGLLAALGGHRVAGTTALVLGAGGTARAATWALVQAGAKVLIWNRTEDRGAELASDLGGAVTSDAAAMLAQCDLLVNCTTVGMADVGADKLSSGVWRFPFMEADLHPGLVIVDFVYGTSPTALISAAHQLGLTAVDGAELLVQQGARSFELWTDRQAPLKVMRAAVAAGE